MEVLIWGGSHLPSEASHTLSFNCPKSFSSPPTRLQALRWKPEEKVRCQPSLLILFGRVLLLLACTHTELASPQVLKFRGFSWLHLPSCCRNIEITDVHCSIQILRGYQGFELVSLPLYGEFFYSLSCLPSPSCCF